MATGIPHPREEVSRFDAIIVPGCGLSQEGELQPWATERLDEAARIHKLGGGLIMVLGAGSAHKPQALDERGVAIYEATAGAQYLVREHEIDPDTIRMEPMSRDTIGNTAFARWLLTDPDPEIKELLVVTSGFAMPRTKMLFEWIFKLPPGGERYNISYREVANTGLSQVELDARAIKETIGLASTQVLVDSIKSVQELQRWMHTGHDAYSVAGMSKHRPPLTAATLKSY